MIDKSVSPTVRQPNLSGFSQNKHVPLPAGAGAGYGRPPLTIDLVHQLLRYPSNACTVVRACLLATKRTCHVGTGTAHVQADRHARERSEYDGTIH